MKQYSQLRQKGFVALIAVALLFIFGFTGIVALYLVNSSALSSQNNVFAAQAFYLAESGLEQSRHKLVTYPSQFSCTGISGNANFTNATFSGARGTYTVTATGNQATTASTLSSNISASVTTIPAVSTTPYDASGRIMIDKELIDYGAISGNNFINVTRGVDGTQNVAHQAGTPIGQYQCTLTSQGGVPNLTTQTSGKRIVQGTLQLASAWTGGGRPSFLPIYRWNRPNEFAWNDYTIAKTKGDILGIYALSYADMWLVGQSYFLEHWDGNNLLPVSPPAGTAQDLYSIACTAYNYCWAVGANQTFLFWNGSTWTKQAVASLPNVTYKSIDCASSNDCWAVGAVSSGDVFVHWNGSTWSRDSSSPTPAVNLNSVKCVAANDCWAVGESGTFVHWNGSAWSTQAVPALPVDTYNQVDCVATDDCWAVGSLGDVYAHWDGSAWSRDPSRPGAARLNAVRCSTSNNCWAVGDGPTTIHWDGSSWVSYSNPGPAAAYLTAVGVIGPYFSPKSIWKEVYP